MAFTKLSATLLTCAQPAPVAANAPRAQRAVTPTSEEAALLAAHLRALKLPAFLSEHERLAADGFDHAPYLLRLAERELADRTRRRIEGRIKQARFPNPKTLDDFDFAVVPSFDKERVWELAQCAFVARHENLIFVGASGTGKTHIAIGLGLAACHKDLSVAFFTAAALVQELIEARARHYLRRLQHRLAACRLLIVDELGYAPLPRGGAGLLFDIVSQRCERGSTIVTSNLALDRWTDVFGDERLTTALLDRLAGQGQVLEFSGESYRLRRAGATHGALRLASG